MAEVLASLFRIAAKIEREPRKEFEAAEVISKRLGEANVEN